MYVVFAEELDQSPPGPGNIARTLDEAFARICCRCGLSYRFNPAPEEGWSLELTDVEHPQRSPDPIFSTYRRVQDAQHDLMSQAVDGRIHGHIALRDDQFSQAMIVRSASGARAMTA